MKKVKSKYTILPEYIGKDVYTMQPSYERKDGCKFTLTNDLPDQDKAFLFEVVGHEGIALQ